MWCVYVNLCTYMSAASCECFFSVRKARCVRVLPVFEWHCFVSDFCTHGESPEGGRMRLGTRYALVIHLWRDVRLYLYFIYLFKRAFGGTMLNYNECRYLLIYMFVRRLAQFLIMMILSAFTCPSIHLSLRWLTRCQIMLLPLSIHLSIYP